MAIIAQQPDQEDVHLVGKTSENDRPWVPFLRQGHRTLVDEIGGATAFGQFYEEDAVGQQNTSHKITLLKIEFQKNSVK